MRIPIALILFCSLAARVSPAHAQAAAGPPPQPSIETPSADNLPPAPIPDIEAKHRALYRRGIREGLAVRDYDTARRYLLESWQLKKAYDVALALAEVEFRTQRYRQAAGYLAYCVRAFPAGEAQQRLSKTYSALQLAKQQVATAHLRNVPSEALIYVDGELQAKRSELPELFLDPGRHQIQARTPEGELLEATLEVEAGKEYDVILARVESSEQRTERSTLPLWVGGGVAVVGATAAVILGLSADADRRDLERRRRQLGDWVCSPAVPEHPSCSTIRDIADRHHTKGQWMTTSIIIGAAGAIGGVATYLLWPELAGSRASARSSGGPLIGGAASPTGGTLWLAGSF